MVKASVDKALDTRRAAPRLQPSNKQSCMSVLFKERMTDAAVRCEENLPEIRKARRQFKPDKLACWKELGRNAIHGVRCTPGADNNTFITQWSQVLDPLGDHSNIISKHRRLPEMIEKRGENVLRELQGQHITAWAPSDTSSLNRLLAHYLRKGPNLAPESILFLVPLPFFSGVSTVSQFLDLWGHALLGEKHASIVKDVSLLPQPMEYVLPCSRGPRHVRQGLACFRIARTGARSLPKIVLPVQPLLQVSRSDSIIIDTPTYLIPRLMQNLTLSEFNALKVRDPKRSVGSTSLAPRTSVEVLLPQGLSPIGTVLLIKKLKRQVITQDMIIGNVDLYTSEDALIMEILSPEVIPRVSPPCSEAIFLSADKILIRTEASSESWVQLMDRLCQEGEVNLVTKVRWKRSNSLKHRSGSITAA